MAAVPEASLVRAFAARAAGRPASAEPLGHATLGADIRQPPLSAFDGVPGHGGEDLFEAVRLVLLAKRRWGTELHDVPEVHDREPLAVALGLLHLMGRDDDRRARLRDQSVQALP